MSVNVYISIGNSDDKLTQSQWHQFVNDVKHQLDVTDIIIHGFWSSSSDAPWQNACWCVEFSHFHPGSYYRLRRALRNLAFLYHQDEIAWAEASTQFLKPEPLIALPIMPTVQEVNDHDAIADT